MEDIRSVAHNRSFTNVDYYAPYGYDGVWALALAYHALYTEQKNSSLRLEDFNYNNEVLSSLLLNTMDTVKFYGVSVSVLITVLFNVKLAIKPEVENVACILSHS